LKKYFGCYAIQQSPLEVETQSELLHCRQTDDNHCKIIILASIGSSNLDLDTNIWNPFLYGSRSQEGVKVGFILIDPHKERTLNFLLIGF
jgi:hypothetical protein